jgi:hypothetical protein
MTIFTGVVYKLISLAQPHLCYVGSSVDLKKRLYKHHYDYENNIYCSSKLILECGGYTVETLQEVKLECENKEVFKTLLKTLEDTFITPQCVNKIRAFRTEAEKKEYDKLYKEENKEAISDYQKEYHKARYEANKEAFSERNKAYYESNREEIAEQSRGYREANKEKIAKQRSAKTTCACGSIYRHDDKSRHCKSHRHIRYEDTLNNNI